MKNSLVHTFFTRKGDSDMNVLDNRDVFLIKNNLSNTASVIINQVHGDSVDILDEMYQNKPCDGIITREKNKALFVRVADCVPLLFFDAVQQVIAVAHAGREGTFKNISGKMIKTFREKFNSEASDIFIKIGPCAQLCCYEVGAETDMHIDFVRSKYGEKFIENKNIDLVGINVTQLQKAGLKIKNIDISSVCTICDKDNYFSFRKNKTEKRFAGVIILS